MLVSSRLIFSSLLPGASGKRVAMKTGPDPSQINHRAVQPVKVGLRLQLPCPSRSARTTCSASADAISPTAFWHGPSSTGLLKPVAVLPMCLNPGWHWRS